MRVALQIPVALATLVLGCSGSISDDPSTLPDGGVVLADGEVVLADGGIVMQSDLAVAISEVMYHPVLEESFEDHHEFVELHNHGTAAVDLGGFALRGGVELSLPAGVMLPPDGYLVVAKDAEALRTVPGYMLDQATVIGDYAGELDNGGETIELFDAAGALVDRVTYDDDFPWPHAADALGAGESWLAAELLPLEGHRARGHSLERVRSDLDGTSVANWVPSPLDGATPGRPNAGAAQTLPAVVIGYNTTTLLGGATITASDAVALTLTLGGAPPPAGLAVEFFVDDVARGDEARSIVMPVDDGTGADSAAGDGQYAVELPSQSENSIVRFRVLLDSGAGPEPISPRPTDPYEFHAYFVDPGVETDTALHHLFVDPARWTQLWDNLGDGRVNGCEPSPTWNERQPAVLAHGGRVYDVQVRYQGSRWNRTNGRVVRNWSHPGPDRPTPPMALSWRIAFPRYQRLDDKKAITINKLTQSCPGLTTAVGMALFDAVDTPTPETRYARLHINGGYFHYGLEVERPGDTMLARYHERLAARTGQARQPIGHLFKSAGCNCDEGPYGWGDGRQLDEHCGYSAYDRYVSTYGRKTHEWASHDALIALIDGLHAARAEGPDALRAYLTAQFDVELTLGYLAVINWSAPFDDMFQNHFLYQRRDGRWMFAPWDLDRNFGGHLAADGSFYIGEQGDRDNRSGWWNYFKDSFLDVYRDEFTARLRTLSEGPLHPDRVGAIVDEVAGSMNILEAEAAPAGTDCDFRGAADDFKAFATRRYEEVGRLP